MLYDGAAIDSILGRGTPHSKALSPDMSSCRWERPLPIIRAQLEADIRASGGHYVEAPVSGSLKPAEAGELVAMLAGDPRAGRGDSSAIGADVPSDGCCAARFPNALLMKIAINHFLIPMVTGLAEAYPFR